MKVLVKRILIYHSKNFHLLLTGKLIRSGISLALTKLNFIAIYFDIRLYRSYSLMDVQLSLTSLIEIKIFS